MALLALGFGAVVLANTTTASAAGGSVYVTISRDCAAGVESNGNYQAIDVSTHSEQGGVPANAATNTTVYDSPEGDNQYATFGDGTSKSDGSLSSTSDGVQNQRGHVAGWAPGSYNWEVQTEKPNTTVTGSAALVKDTCESTSPTSTVQTTTASPTTASTTKSTATPTTVTTTTTTSATTTPTATTSPHSTMTHSASPSTGNSQSTSGSTSKKVVAVAPTTRATAKGSMVLGVTAPTGQSTPPYEQLGVAESAFLALLLISCLAFAVYYRRQIQYFVHGLVQPPRH